MLTIKGFVSHKSYISNTPNVVSTIGELSSIASTFSTDRGIYSDAAFPNVQLTTFLANLNSNDVQLPNDVATHILDVASFAYNLGAGGAAPTTPSDFVAALLNHFTATASTFTCGSILNIPGLTVPEWISWTMTNTASTPNTIRIWLSDQSFQSEYDEFKIKVVPPIPHLDDFFKTASEVTALLNSITMAENLDVVQSIRGDWPETILSGTDQPYYNLFNSNTPVNVTWAYLIYGAAGNNIDSIKEAIVNYIMANTTHSIDDWKKIFPEIFRRTEYVIRPFWENVAIPQRDVQTGIYSPVLYTATAIPAVKQSASFYTEAHINSNVSFVGHLFKSLMLGVVPGPDNRINTRSLNEIYPDFISVSSESLDFNRMRPSTITWATALENLLIIAEKATTYSSLPKGGYSKVTRDGKLYIVKSVGNVNYLVYAKSNLTT